MSLLKRSRKKVAKALAIREIDELYVLAQNVYFLRQGLDLSQEALAEKAELTQPQVANIEAGHANPTVRTLARLAHGLGTSACQLFAPLDNDGKGGVDLTYAYVSVPSDVFRAGGEMAKSEQRTSAEFLWEGKGTYQQVIAAAHRVDLEIEETEEPMARAS
jgi:transcriptional regulator with XRE-family HTH domain